MKLIKIYNLMQKKYLALSFFSAVLVLFFYFFLPTTAPYKSYVRSLWYPSHFGLVYYLNRDDADLAMQMGDWYFTSGQAYDLHKAEVLYARAMALDPHMYLAHYELARIYFVQGDLTKATDFINQELQINPYTLRPLYVRGLIELAQSNLPAAEDDFTRFVAWSPGEWGGYNDLAFTLAKEAKFAESEAVLKQALKKVPDAEANPWLWNGLGLAQLNQLRYTDAEASFEKASVLAHTITLVQWERAYSANDPEAASESIAAFQQSIQKNLTIAKRGGTIGG